MPGPATPPTGDQAQAPVEPTAEPAPAEPAQAEPAATAEPEEPKAGPSTVAPAEEESKEPSTATPDNPRVVLRERSVRLPPPPGPAALEANERAQVQLVPQAERVQREQAQRDLAEAREILEEEEPHIPQELLELAEWDTDSSFELVSDPEATEAETAASPERVRVPKPGLAAPPNG